MPGARYVGKTLHSGVADSGRNAKFRWCAMAVLTNASTLRVVPVLLRLKAADLRTCGYKLCGYNQPYSPANPGLGIEE